MTRTNMAVTDGGPIKPDAKTILVMCPYKDVLKFLVSVLEKQGYIVFGAEQLDEGIQLCETLKLDLILTEMNLDHKTGAEVAECIRKRMGASFGVIYLAGIAHPELEKAMSETGTKRSWILKKPFSVPEMMELVNKAFTTE